MAIFWRVALVLVVFVGVGLLAAHLIYAHELAREGAPLAEVRLVSWMAGLFAGGAAATLAGLATLIKRRR